MCDLPTQYAPIGSILVTEANYVGYVHNMLPC